MNKLINRTIELPDDILDSKHHPKCHLSMDDSGSSKDSYKDVFYLVDRDTTYLLDLIKIEALKADFK